LRPQSWFFIENRTKLSMSLFQYLFKLHKWQFWFTNNILNSTTILSSDATAIRRYYTDFREWTLYKVYPELVFQISILRDKIDKLVVPNAANKDCGDAGQQSHRFCGHQSFSSPISRQIWPWMAQLLEVLTLQGIPHLKDMGVVIYDF